MCRSVRLSRTTGPSAVARRLRSIDCREHPADTSSRWHPPRASSGASAHAARARSRLFLVSCRKIRQSRCQSMSSPRPRLSHATTRARARPAEGRHTTRCRRAASPSVASTGKDGNRPTPCAGTDRRAEKGRRVCIADRGNRDAAVGEFSWSTGRIQRAVGRPRSGTRTSLGRRAEVISLIWSQPLTSQGRCLCDCCRYADCASGCQKTRDPQKPMVGPSGF